MIQERRPKAFLKYAGGKTKLLSILLPELPQEYATYIEPFIGSGALFFAVQPKRAVISDINCELINLYEVIRDRLDDMLFLVDLIPNTKEAFYETRGWQLDLLNEVNKAARFLYLNKTCFNGLYRENSKGQFNVPYGYYKNPKIYDLDNIRKVSECLKNDKIRLYCQGYKESLRAAKSDDFVYLDPPYHVVSKTSFTKYTKNDFKEADHIDLAEEFKRLTQLGCKAMLSNADTPFIVDLYKGFNQIKIITNRAINSKGSLRKGTGLEIIVKNY